MRIRSKFPSTCARCGNAIVLGEEIEWAPGTKPTHPVCEAPAPTEKPKFVLALEQIGKGPSVRAPWCPKPSAREHFVKLVVQYGERPSMLDPPIEADEILLTVGPDNQTMERALICEGLYAFYLRFNAGPFADTSVNNVVGAKEIGWRIKWSPPVKMAVEGLRLR